MEMLVAVSVLTEVATQMNQKAEQMFVIRLPLAASKPGRTRSLGPMD